MTKLNDALALFLGTQVITAAYLGDHQVWGNASIPINSSVPIVTGAVYEGDTATTTNGTWSGSPTGYEYKWQEDTGSWTDVSGETANTFEDMPIGEFRSAVRAENAEGWSDWAYSAPFVVSVPSSGLEWDAGYRVTIVGNTATHSTGGIGTVYTAPVTGSIYFEIEVSNNGNADNRGGVWCITTPFDPGGSQPIGQIYANQSLGAAQNGEWFWAIYANEEYVVGDTPNNSLTPFTRWGFAYDSVTRRLWVRQVWVGGASAWMSATMPADPATNTNPTAIFTGSDSARISASVVSGASVVLIAPDNHYGTAPSGFTPT